MWVHWPFTMLMSCWWENIILLWCSSILRLGTLTCYNITPRYDPPWMLFIPTHFCHQGKIAQLVHYPKVWSSRRNNPEKMWRIAKALKIKPKSWWARDGQILWKMIPTIILSIGHHQWVTTTHGGLMKRLFRSVMLSILLSIILFWDHI